MYQINSENGYITSIARGVSDGNISAEEYGEIKRILKSKPIPPEGYGYRLKCDLTWEAFELPVITEDIGDTEGQGDA